MHVVYANCFGAPQGDLLLTEEPGLGGELVDRLVTFEEAQALNARVWELAFSWTGDEDSSVVDGVSAADVAGAEIALSALMPAARGVLGMRAGLQAVQPSRLTLAWAGGGWGHNARIESIQARSAGLASGLDGNEVVVDDARNASLFGKYHYTRDIDYLAYLNTGPAAERMIKRLANALAAVTHPGSRDTVAVLEYNPTRAFATRYATRRSRLRLARLRSPREDVLSVIRAGDRMMLSSREPGASQPHSITRRIELAGIDVWPVVGPAIEHIVGRYMTYLRGVVPLLRSQLEKWNTRAVLVPFDTPPEARVLVRTAQAMDIPTFVLSDGFKGDDFTVEGATADFPLAWSEALATNYFGRWPDKRPVVTGNPKAEGAPPPASDVGPPGRRVLVGSFTFSPVDLNCRRSDPERFAEEVVAGVREAWPDAEITLKLHPADRPEHYVAMGVRVTAAGDIVNLFDEHDLYVATYSTSLIEAVSSGLAVAYYRVNDQRLHAPFSGDAYVERRSAGSPSELAALLRDYPSDDGFDVGGWVEHYLGPSQGASERVAAAIESELASS